MGSITSCSGATFDANVSGTAVNDISYQTCTGLGLSQMMIMTMRRCDPIGWGCVFTFHPEYGQPKKSWAAGSLYLPGSWNVTRSYGYWVYCDHWTQGADGSVVEDYTESQQFSVP